MESWIAQAPAMIAAVVLLTGYGAIVVAPFRVGRLALLALAPLASVAVLGILAIVLGLLGVAWNLPGIAVGCVAVAVITWTAGRLIGGQRRPRQAPGFQGWLLLSGLILGVLLGALRIAFYIGDAEAISQTNDAVFHLNALRFAVETGQASSFGISGVIGSTAFYPAAWHALVLAVAGVSGASLPGAINAVSIAIAAAVWVPGVAWLTREAVARSNPDRAMTAGAFAAALAPALLAFPLLMLQWGVLYPNALSVAMIPAAAALVLVASDWIRGEGMRLNRARPYIVIIMVLAAAAAIGLAQPAGLLAWLILSACILTWQLLGRRALTDARARRIVALQLVALWGVSAVVWLGFVITGPSAHWTSFETAPRAILDLLTNGVVGLPAQLLMSILMVVGIVVAVRAPRLRWLALAWCGFALLYFIAAAIDFAGVRRLFLGPWYADPYRLAALMPLVVVPLAAIGLTRIVFAVTERVRLSSGKEWIVAGSMGTIAAVGGVLLAVVPVTQLPLITSGITDSESRYAINGATYLSTDERELLERLPEVLPEDARVIGNPSTGMGFAYALSGVDAIPRTWAPPSGDEWAILAASLRDAGEDPRVCTALAAFDDPGYVLDFGDGEVTSGRFTMPGFTDFEGQPGFELVDAVGDAAVWRITAC